MNLDRPNLIFQSPDEREAFFEFERQRAARSDVRPFGARLSTPCPVRMVQAIFDESARTPIDPGDAERGHEMESRVRATLLAGIEHQHQPRIDWAHGVSAFDIRLAASGDLLELKSTVGRLNVHHDYKTTTLRRMVAAGMSAGDAVQIIVVSPSNYRFAGPFPVVLTQDDVERWTVQLGKVGKALAYLAPDDAPERSDTWREGAWWRQRFGLECDCGGCTDHTQIDANGKVESLGFRWELAMDSVEAASAMLGGKASFEWRDENGVRGQLIAALDRQIDRHREAAILAGKPIVVETYMTDRGLRASWSPKTGRWLIKRRKAQAVAAA